MKPLSYLYIILLSYVISIYVLTSLHTMHAYDAGWYCWKCQGHPIRKFKQKTWKWSFLFSHFLLKGIKILSWTLIVADNFSEQNRITLLTGLFFNSKQHFISPKTTGINFLMLQKWRWHFNKKTSTVFCHTFIQISEEIIGLLNRYSTETLKCLGNICHL